MSSLLQSEEQRLRLRLHGNDDEPCATLRDPLRRAQAFKDRLDLLPRRTAKILRQPAEEVAEGTSLNEVERGLRARVMGEVGLELEALDRKASLTKQLLQLLGVDVVTHALGAIRIATIRGVRQYFFAYLLQRVRMRLRARRDAQAPTRLQQAVDAAQ